MPFVIRKFTDDQTLGTQLKAMRHEINFTLTEMAERTKIRKGYLEAFECDRHNELPESLYARKFLKTYVQALGGDPDYFVKRFESARGTCDISGASRLPLARTRAMAFFTSTRLIPIAAFSIVSLAIIGYLGWQVQSIIAPPELEVIGPNDGFITDEAMLTVRGKAPTKSHVKINDTDVLLSKDGSFETEVALERGLNVITIEGSKRYSRQTTLYRRVILEANGKSVSTRLNSTATP